MIKLCCYFTGSLFCQMKCSACGGRGHMKTNKNCPMYKSSSITVAPTDSELAQQEASLSQDDLIKVEGTKVGRDGKWEELAYQPCHSPPCLV